MKHFEFRSRSNVEVHNKHEPLILLLLLKDREEGGEPPLISRHRSLVNELFFV